MKNKKGAALAVIAEAMVLISLMFIIMSTGVILNVTANKMKKLSCEMKNDILQLNIYIDQMMQENLTASGKYNAAVTSLGNKLTANYFGFERTEDFKYLYPYSLRDSTTEGGVKTMLQYENVAKSQVKITRRANTSTTGSFQTLWGDIIIEYKKSNKDSVYFTCVLKYVGNASSGHYEKVSWNYKI